MVGAADGLHRMLRTHHVVGTGHGRGGPLTLVLRGHDDVIRLHERFDRDQREDADRPGADDVNRSSGGDLGAEGRVDRARQWLDQHGGLVAHPVGHRPELRAVGEHQAAPSAARLRAIARLEPGLEMPHRDPVATADMSCRAMIAGRVLPACGASEDARDHDPLPGHEVADVVEELADHLVAGYERQRHERREVERRLPGDRREVAPADPGEEGLHAAPSLALRLRILLGHEPERSEPAGHEPRCLRAERARAEVLRCGAIELERQGHGSTSSPASGSGPAACPSTSPTPRSASGAVARTDTGGSRATPRRGSPPRGEAGGRSRSPRRRRRASDRRPRSTRSAGAMPLSPRRRAAGWT